MTKLEYRQSVIGFGSGGWEWQPCIAIRSQSNLSCKISDFLSKIRITNNKISDLQIKILLEE